MRLDIKRLNLPFVITSTCPRCGGEVKVDLSTHPYLSYPLVGEPFKHTLYHACVDEKDRFEDNEWAVTLRLVVELQAVADCTVEAKP